jgi:hypothetical protein
MQNLLTGRACSRRLPAHKRRAAAAVGADAPAPAAAGGSVWDCSATANLTGSVLFLGDSTDCLVMEQGCKVVFPGPAPALEPDCHGEWGVLHMCRGSQQPGAQLVATW